MSTRKRSDEDFDREVRAHIEIETERLIDEGMPADAARVAARRRFGNVTGVRERFYEARRLLWLDHAIQTMAGIYGVLAFAIARRARELAVRVAIGASAADVVRLVTAHTARLIAAGSALGLFLMFGLSRLVRAGGGAGSIWDPSLYSFVVPVVVVVVVGAIATWIPSRRALKIDPVVLLRTP